MSLFNNMTQVISTGYTSDYYYINALYTESRSAAAGSILAVVSSLLLGQSSCAAAVSNYSPADRPCYIAIAIVPYYYSPADRPCYIAIAIVPYYYYSSVRLLRPFPLMQINQIAHGASG